MLVFVTPQSNRICGAQRGFFLLLMVAHGDTIYQLKVFCELENCNAHSILLVMVSLVMGFSVLMCTHHTLHFRDGHHWQEPAEQQEQSHEDSEASNQHQSIDSGRLVVTP